MRLQIVYTLLDWPQIFQPLTRSQASQNAVMVQKSVQLEVWTVKIDYSVKVIGMDSFDCVCLIGNHPPECILGNVVGRDFTAQYVRFIKNFYCYYHDRQISYVLNG